MIVDKLSVGAGPSSQVPKDSVHSASETENLDIESADSGQCRSINVMAVESSGLEGKYLYDIPYGVTRDISLSLDADRSWETLAGEVGYTFEKIKIFELEYHRYSGSPTKALLWDWGSRNATIKDLYIKLKSIDRIKEMRIIEEYWSSAKWSMNSIQQRRDNNFDDSQRNATPSTLPSIDPAGLPKPPPPRRSGGETGSSPSEVNFNQMKVQMTGSKVMTKTLKGDSLAKEKKVYDDKIIPGFQSQKPQKGEIMSGAAQAECQKVPQESSCRHPVESDSSQNLQESSTIRTHGTSLNRHPQESVSSSSNNMSSKVSSSSGATFGSSLTSSDYTKEVGLLRSFMEDNNVDVNIAVAMIGSTYYTYRELEKCTNGFDSSCILGEGAFGTVYLGVLRDNKCAIKRLQQGSTSEKNKERSQQLKSELTALLKYRHENIVTLYGYALDGPALCLVYQYMVNGSVEDRLQCKGNTTPLLWSLRIDISCGAARGLQYLHNMGDKPLIHGDIKSANILLDKHFEAKIGDLGQAQHANSGTETGKFTHITKKDMNSKIYGTKAYLAPELLRGSASHSTKTDVYAFGVVLLEICSGERAFDERREPNKFLPSHFSDIADGCEDDKLSTLFKDKKAGECKEAFFLSLLKCAQSCISKLKKSRPDMSMVTKELHDIESKWKDDLGCGTHSGQPGSVHSCHMSHYSGQDFSAQNLADNVEDHRITPGCQIKGHLLKIPPQGGHLFGQPISPSRCQPGQTNPDSAKLYNDHKSVISPQTGIVQLPPGTPLPDSLKMQLTYDYKKQGLDSEKIAERLKELELHGSNLASLKDEHTFYELDPKKMAEMQRYQAEMKALNPGMYSPNSSGSMESENLKTDPKKLAALKMFDEKNMMTKCDKDGGTQNEKEQMSNQEYIPSADPKKLKALEDFDKKNPLQVEMSSSFQVSDRSESRSPPSCSESVKYCSVPAPSNLDKDNVPVSSSYVHLRSGVSPNAYDPKYRESEGFVPWLHDERGSVLPSSLSHSNSTEDKTNNQVLQKNMDDLFNQYNHLANEETGAEEFCEGEEENLQDGCDHCS